MAKSGGKYSFKVALGSHDSRLKKGPAKEMCDFIYSRMLTPEMAASRFEPMIQYNLAHMLELYDKKIVGHEVAAKVLQTLKWIKKQGLEHFKLDVTLEQLMPNMEAIVVNELGEPVGGTILTGRARGDVELVATVILLRGKLLDLFEEIYRLRKLVLELGDKHTTTLMPGFTHMQHAQPSTLGHYFACIAEAFEIDCKRLEVAYKRVNTSPAEAGIGWGTSFPVDRKRVAALLGFDGVIENTRYALTSLGGIETLAALAILTVDINRFADDIFFWSLGEFGYAEVADEFASTSYIMPQKKNLTSLEEYLHLTSRAITAFVQAAIPVSQNSFGMLPHIGVSHIADSEQTAAKTIDDIIEALRLLCGIVSTLKFNEDVMRKAAAINFAQATDLADTLFRDKGISFRTAHKIVGALIREALAHGQKPAEIDTHMLDLAAIEVTGKSVELHPEVLRKTLDPMENVKARKGFGAVAPEAVQESLKNRFYELGEDMKSLKEKRRKLSFADEELEALVLKITGK